MTTIPSSPPIPRPPFLLTPFQIAHVGRIPEREVLLAIESGDLRTIGGSESLVQRRHAEEWLDRRHPHDDHVHVAPSAPVNPLTGKVHREITIDPVTGDRL